MAAHYLEKIRAMQPEGPYLLGGWSMGGMVAYEMARQLREGGEGVEMLAVLDCEAPSVDSREPAIELGAEDTLGAFARELGLSPEAVAEPGRGVDLGGPLL